MLFFLEDRFIYSYISNEADRNILGNTDMKSDTWSSNRRKLLHLAHAEA